MNDLTEKIEVLQNFLDAAEEKNLSPEKMKKNIFDIFRGAISNFKEPAPSEKAIYAKYYWRLSNLLNVINDHDEGTFNAIAEILNTRFYDWRVIHAEMYNYYIKSTVPKEKTPSEIIEIDHTHSVLAYLLRDIKEIF